ncbi:hypothetical protein Tco_0099105, partial [Tanacetum coccineum]
YNPVETFKSDLEEFPPEATYEGCKNYETDVNVYLATPINGDEVVKTPNGFEVMVTSEQGAFEPLEFKFGVRLGGWNFEPLTILLFAHEAVEIPYSYRDEARNRRVMQSIALTMHTGDIEFMPFIEALRQLFFSKDTRSANQKENTDEPGWKHQFLFDELRVLMPRVVKSRDEIFSRWGYCDNHDLSRLDNQSIERDRLIGIGFVLNFVKFISFTFGDKEMISVIEAVSR